MRWIQICTHGHIDDVDWWWYVHRAAKDSRTDCSVRDRLLFETVGTGGSAGLDTLQVRCSACNARKSLSGITAAGSAQRAGMSCTGRQPWQGVRRDDAKCLAEIKIVQRGASNVYFPVVHSSIEVPDPSRSNAHSTAALEIQNHHFFHALVAENADPEAEAFLARKLASATDVNLDFVMALVHDARRRAAGSASVVEEGATDLRGEEWAAFVTPTDDPLDRDFVTRHVDLLPTTLPPEVVASLKERVSRVVIGDRLREVRALEGFHRVIPAEGTMVRADLGHGLDWLPAVEVRGEGVFITLDEKRLQSWEKDGAVQRRVGLLADRAAASLQRARIERLTGHTLSPRFVLLHTLAHLLMRRLAHETGYGAASLRERVYARKKDSSGSGNEAGLLIYTAAGDSEGTLGGLARQGEAPLLAHRLVEALADARWCASDPLCVESRATSLDSLNMAACHACSFVSETSCEIGNFVLDRVLVVGSDDVPGFFQPVLDAALAAATEALA